MTPPADPVLDQRPQLTSTDGLEHLYATQETTLHVDAALGIAQAVVYLRVSTPRQLHTAADIDEDGNSIATQRVETGRKARELGASVAHEFVEPGQSAQTIQKRPEFKQLLRYLDEHPEVKYVLIYMRSRVFRNFTDAAITKRQLLEKGVRLISAKEEFGEGYMADAMEAITDVMNEVQVRMNGEDVRVKMAHKVEQGGSVGRAKLGYKNARKDYGGRLVNTIDVDPDRAPLVTWAFEQYATGQYSVFQLRGALEEHGLTTRASPTQPERPVSNSRLAQILRDPYYTGVIRYKGRLYAGRHQPLTSKETFLKVQEILNQRKRQGDRDIVHFHFLKGLIYCGPCWEAGRRSRLLYTQAKGNGGTYEYFICTAKQRGLCSTPAIPVAQMEGAIARLCDRERLRADEIDAMRAGITEAIDDLLEADRQAKAALRKQLSKLEAQEDRLIELAADRTMSVPKLRAKLEQTTLQKAAVAEQLELTADRLRYGAEKAIAFIELLREPGAIFHGAPDPVRRDLLGALFSRILVHVEEPDLRTTPDRSETNVLVRELAKDLSTGAEPSGSNDKPPRETARGRKTEEPHSSPFVHGLSKTRLAGVPGLEPRTTEPESAVLPITPHPIAAPQG